MYACLNDYGRVGFCGILWEFVLCALFKVVTLAALIVAISLFKRGHGPVGGTRV